jgi:hypothetical protein
MDTLDTFNSDHFLLIGFFDFLSFKDMRAPSYLKQRSQYRTVYNIHAALPDQKALFTSEVDAGLRSPIVSTNNNNNLNRETELCNINERVDEAPLSSGVLL